MSPTFAQQKAELHFMLRKKGVVKILPRMKKLSVLFILTTLLGSSCQNKELEEENAALKETNTELKKEVAQKDSIFQDFATIQQNLAQIREKEEGISKLKKADIEQSDKVKERILSDIEAINGLLEENRETVKRMNDKLKRYSYEVGKFKRIVANLKDQIARKDTQIVVLKQRLAALNFEMAKINSVLSSTRAAKEKQEKVLEEKQEMLNTAYYAVGTAKDLEENGVLTKKGGIIGIGSTKTLKEDLNLDYFTKINKKETNEIPLNYEAKDIQLISNHEPDSYEVVKGSDYVEALKIKSVDEFWKTTNYLVIVLK